MGIDTRTFEQILRTTGDYKGTDCLILGDCAFHVHNMTLDRFKEVCGFRTVSTIDLFGSPTIKADLQAPPAPELLGKFGVIIDAGTLFCCFDIAGIWRNLLDMLTPNGMIFHHSALSGYLGEGITAFNRSYFAIFIARMVSRLNTWPSVQIARRTTNTPRLIRMQYFPYQATKLCSALERSLKGIFR